jgi:hypothetical protein
MIHDDMNPLVSVTTHIGQGLLFRERIKGIMPSYIFHEYLTCYIDITLVLQELNFNPTINSAKDTSFV